MSIEFYNPKSKPFGPLSNDYIYPLTVPGVTKKQRDKLFGLVKRDGVTLIPISIYFNEKGLVKLKLGIAKGRKQHDKRELIKQRDWDRQKAIIIKNHS